MPMRRTDRGFTLVELMVVISIIGVLVMLLVPTISAGQMIARKAATSSTIKRLGMGLETYKADFGEYPPSKVENWNGTGPQRYRGAAKLVYYLAGPGGDGWGINAAGHMPYEATMPGMARPTRSYGPYFKATSEVVSYETDSATGRQYMCAFNDAFKPPGKILYFRYEAHPTVVAGKPEDNFQVSDNNDASLGKDVGDQDSQRPARKNYFSQLSLMQAGVPWDVAGSAIRFRIPRDDYFLVSPGPDGIYGWVDAGNKPVNRTTSVAMKNDDITSF